LLLMETVFGELKHSKRHEKGTRKMMIYTWTTGKIIVLGAVRTHSIRLFLQSLTSWWTVTLFVFVLGSLGVIEHATAAGPWKGQIVDKETGKPLEGVIVLATWYKAYSTPGGWGGGGYYDSEEVATDIDGRFTIQSKQTWTINPFSAIKGPEFYIFKSGYGQWQFQGQDRWSKDALESEEQRKQTWQKFVGEGVTLELPRLTSDAARLRFLSRPNGEIPSDRMPKYLKALDRERINLGLRPGYVQ
jgi:hypothetical protein